MLSPTLILRAAQSTINKFAPAVAHISPGATLSTPPAQANSQPLKTNFLYFIYQPIARPVNCTTFTSTRAILIDPSHPLHIRTTRRYATFNPDSLHWNVVVPVDVSKKAVVRNWVRRRIGVAFKRVLRDREEVGRLKGALSIRVRVDMAAAAITASGMEVEREVTRVVGAVLAKIEDGDRTEKGRGLKRPAGIRSMAGRSSPDPRTLLEKDEQV